MTAVYLVVSGVMITFSFMSAIGIFPKSGEPIFHRGNSLTVCLENYMDAY